MLEIKDIEKLAKLARIELTNEEKQKLLKEVDPILGYVAQLKEVTSKVEGGPKVGDLRNVMREDSNSTESGVNTDVLVKEMPASQGNYLKVKKIL
ncbi:MAG: Asp-tRNA(Asn)/Glu-tRNA(Gln) amidotransferase subunit GatC [Candidatus Paceibacterota bacterium]|jgi:aspartyl-tRNA(Asn)/glutamyl-tRNA(Gln) amidotransferase subunit C